MTKDYFKTRGYTSDGLIHNSQNQALNIQALPPFLRTLLVTDGTVTKSLEAYFWEAIRIELQSQSSIRLEQDLPLISAKKGTEVLQRDVILRGQPSDEIYCHASSYIKLESLREGLSSRLVKGEIGIGELLREVGLETYREIKDFSCGSYPIKAISPISDELEQSNSNKVETIDRVYIINVSGKAAIQITERFPLALFQTKQPG